MSSSVVNLTRSNILGLYRDLLRASATLPTDTKRDWVARRTRREFRKFQHETEPETIELQLRLAMTQLDTVRTQAEHLRRIEEGSLGEQEEASRPASITDHIYG